MDEMVVTLYDFYMLRGLCFGKVPLRCDTAYKEDLDSSIRVFRPIGFGWNVG